MEDHRSQLPHAHVTMLNSDWNSRLQTMLLIDVVTRMFESHKTAEVAQILLILRECVPVLGIGRVAFETETSSATPHFNRL